MPTLGERLKVPRNKRGFPTGNVKTLGTRLKDIVNARPPTKEQIKKMPLRFKHPKLMGVVRG